MIPYQSDQQWKLEGDCQKCRRKKYCSSQCRPRKNLEWQTIVAGFENACDKIPALSTYKEIFR